MQRARHGQDLASPLISGWRTIGESLLGARPPQATAGHALLQQLGLHDADPATPEAQAATPWDDRSPEGTVFVDADGPPKAGIA